MDMDIVKQNDLRIMYYVTLRVLMDSCRSRLEKVQILMATSITTKHSTYE